MEMSSDIFNLFFTYSSCLKPVKPFQRTNLRFLNTQDSHRLEFHKLEIEFRLTCTASSSNSSSVISGPTEQCTQTPPSSFVFEPRTSARFCRSSSEAIHPWSLVPLVSKRPE